MKTALAALLALGLYVPAHTMQLKESSKPGAIVLRGGIPILEPDYVTDLMGNLKIDSPSDQEKINPIIDERTNLTQLHNAANEGKLQECIELLTNKANVNVLDTYKETPLHKAAYFEHIDVCNLLIAYKAEIDAVNYKNKTPLYFAASQNEAALCLRLIAHNAELNKKILNNVFYTFSSSNIANIFLTILLKNTITPLNLVIPPLVDIIIEYALPHKEEGFQRYRIYMKN